MAYIFALLSLAITCYDEAGGQGHSAMRFVADTVITRVNSDKFPNTVEGVIYQPNQFAWTKKYRHGSVEALRKTSDMMIKQKEPHAKKPIVWLEALDVAQESLAKGYVPKHTNLYFSSKEIKAHGHKFAYKPVSKHIHK